MTIRELNATLQSHKEWTGNQRQYAAEQGRKEGLDVPAEKSRGHERGR